MKRRWTAPQSSAGRARGGGLSPPRKRLVPGRKLVRLRTPRRTRALASRRDELDWPGSEPRGHRENNNDSACAGNCRRVGAAAQAQPVSQGRAPRLTTGLSAGTPSAPAPLGAGARDAANNGTAWPMRPDPAPRREWVRSHRRPRRIEWLRGSRAVSLRFEVVCFRGRPGEAKSSTEANDESAGSVGSRPAVAGPHDCIKQGPGIPRGDEPRRSAES